MDRPRGALVDRCDRCGSLVRQRTVEQNAALHALLTDVALQRDWPRGSGQLHGVTFWKQMVMCGWERLNKREVEFYPSIEGDGMDPVFRRRTSRLNKKEMSELLEYLSAWAVEEGIAIRHREAA